MTTTSPTPPIRIPRDAVVIRFAGDSGDGMQITGSEFAVETALAGNDLATFPDFPAEIRAPQGTTFGVSAFQIHFGNSEVMTAGGELVEHLPFREQPLFLEIVQAARDEHGARDLGPVDGSGHIVIGRRSGAQRSSGHEKPPGNRPLQW